MGIVDRLQQVRDRKARWQPLRAAILGMPADERSEFLAEIIVEVESTPSAVEPTAPKATKTTSPKTEGSYTDRAEALVFEHPEGINTADVGRGIGQPTANADGTLRQIMTSRKTIERRDGMWFPIASGVVPSPTAKVTNRDAVIQALKSSVEPLGAADIFDRVVAIKPDAKKPSIDSELNRLRKEQLLVLKGSGPRGGLYGLQTEGSESATQG